jgi:pimeloyl-ACP methyl ester carboxylesterase
LQVAQEVLDDLRDRLARTRWPETETVATPGGAPDWSQGPPLAYVAPLVDAWSRYDWRRMEAELNAHGQGLAAIDGLDIHFLHVRSPRADARPLVITHGWPSSVVEPLAVMDALADPPEPALPAFHVVAPSLPGFGFGGKPTTTGWNVNRTADAWVELMDRLGYQRFFAAGGDWGGRVTAALGHRHPERIAGLHSFTPYVPEPAESTAYGPLTDQDRRWLAARGEVLPPGPWLLHGAGHPSPDGRLRPDRLPRRTADLAAGQVLGLDRSRRRPARGDQRGPDARPRNLLLTVGNGRIVGAVLLENEPPDNSGTVTLPSAVTIFPADIDKVPRPWVESRFTDLRYYREALRGGHLPMLEVPDSYADELRNSLGSMPW